MKFVKSVQCILSVIIHGKAKCMSERFKLIENQWIPVKERVPIFTGYAVLAILENAYGQRKVEKISTGYGRGERWYCNNKCIDMEKWKVIAWMPLPDAYGGKR